MEEKYREQIVGKFYTVEDLMDLPEAGCVDPAKAHEVSRAMPIRLWMDTQKLIVLLQFSMGAIRRNNLNAPPAEARQAEILMQQRKIWIDHLEESEEENTYIGIFPASPAGDEHDQEAAVTG